MPNNEERIPMKRKAEVILAEIAATEKQKEIAQKE